MRFASAHRVPVVPQGARSGISGGANASPGAILLNVSKMKDVVAVNEAERSTVQPGIINQDLNHRTVRTVLPAGSGSVALSSIGGNIENAGGLCVGNGVTRIMSAHSRSLATGSSHARPQTAKGVASQGCHLFIGPKAPGHRRRGDAPVPALPSRSPRSDLPG